MLSTRLNRVTPQILAPLKRNWDSRLFEGKEYFQVRALGAAFSHLCEL